jgi:transmembrane sensor
LSRHYIAYALLAFVAISVVAVVQLGLLSGSEVTSSGLYATAVGQQKSSTLDDGSVVMLNTNSQIRVDYNERFRKIYLLQGEVHFSVARDSGRPFRVYAGNGRIQAVGTAFSVFLDREDISITVVEGRVAKASFDNQSASSPGKGDRQPSPGKPDLQTEPDDDLVFSLGTIDAGHVATLRASTGQQPLPASDIKEIVRQIPPEELAQRLSWREGILMFSGDTLEDVVKEVSRYTTVTIEIPDAAVREMRIGGRLRVGETGSMLAALETNFDLRVVNESRDRVLLVPAKSQTSDYQ